jgi:hypothetical protein
MSAKRPVPRYRFAINQTLFHQSADGRTAPVHADLSHDRRDGGTERGEAVQDVDTNLKLCNLAVAVSHHVPLTQQFLTVYLGFDAVSAVAAALSSPKRTAEVFRCPQDLVARDRCASVRSDGARSMHCHTPVTVRR